MTRPARDSTPDDQLRECDCPKRDGMIYHLQGSCTDPIANRLAWFASEESA